MPASGPGHPPKRPRIRGYTIYWYGEGLARFLIGREVIITDPKSLSISITRSWHASKACNRSRSLISFYRLLQLFVTSPFSSAWRRVC